jgi:peptidoglycan/xylan/chitin deacetylase (PgdA/CDA1 family)
MKKIKLIFLSLCILSLLVGCTANAQPANEPAIEAAPADTDTPEPVVEPTDKPTATNAPSPIPEDTSTPLPLVRQMPMTLMLSQPTSKLDSVAFLEEMIPLIEQEGLQVVTYHDLNEDPGLTATAQGKLMIITIDNIYLKYPINDKIMQMINLLKEAGYPAVLGIITEGERADPETSATLRELMDLGWEIASNSDTYRNLMDVQQIAPKSIADEINSSLDKLQTATGIRPITFILPYGAMIDEDEQIKRTDLIWVVGFYGGETYDTEASYYYVGRQNPAGTAEQTMETMMQRFNP